jgi:Xaa-Pro aminopeptidase
MSPSWQRVEEPRRIAALRAVMRERELDAILIVGGINLSYFSGFAGLERSMARAMLYLCPREGEPVMIAHTFRKHLIEAHSWVREFRYFTRLSQAPVQTLQEALRDRAIVRGRIGMELGFESQIQLPQAEFERLRTGLREFSLIDVAEDLWRIRYVRSGAELERQESAAALATTVITEAFGHAREGMRQGDLAHFIQERFLHHRVAANYSLISAGTDNYDFCGAWTPDYRFRRGDMVWVDIGAQSGGYCAAFSRAGVIGEPSPQQRDTARAVYDATMHGISAVRPGTRIADVATLCETALSAIDAPVTTNIATLGTRFGHGMGLEFVEPPHVAAYDNTVLAPGMVVAIEPGLATRYGRFHFRELAVVTDTGFRLLAGPSPDLVSLPLS